MSLHKAIIEFFTGAGRMPVVMVGSDGKVLHREGRVENPAIIAARAADKQRMPLPGYEPCPGPDWTLRDAKISNPPADDDRFGFWAPPGHRDPPPGSPRAEFLHKLARGKPREHFGKRRQFEPTPHPLNQGPQARANAWKTHEADTLRFAIAYALQMANANGDNCGVRWLRAWSEGSPAALAELRAALAHGEIPY